MLEIFFNYNSTYGDKQISFFFQFSNLVIDFNLNSIKKSNLNVF